MLVSDHPQSLMGTVEPTCPTQAALLWLVTCAFSYQPKPVSPNSTCFATTYQVGGVATAAKGCHPRWPRRHRKRPLPAILDTETRQTSGSDMPVHGQTCPPTLWSTSNHSGHSLEPQGLLFVQDCHDQVSPGTCFRSSHAAARVLKIPPNVSGSWTASALQMMSWYMHGEVQLAPVRAGDRNGSHLHPRLASLLCPHLSSWVNHSAHTK